MMEILERQRNAHEDIERMEQAIVDRMAEDPRTRYDALAMEHQVAEFLTNIQRQADFLVETYRDENGARQKEIESMAGATNEFDKFYQEYAELREIHRRRPGLQVEDLEKNYRKRSREEIDLEDPITNMFTGEESWGRFIDLNPLHEIFLNLRGGFPQFPYIKYLQEFQLFRNFNPKAKNNDYLKYLIALQEYLESFLKRVQPIVNHPKLMNKISNEFENAWENGIAPGQKDEQSSATNGSSPLYCDVCQKQFAKETVYNAHLEGNKHKKNAERADANGEKDDEAPLPAGQMTREQRRKEVSRHEYTITKLCQGEKLSKIIPNTVLNVERRSLLSDRERRKELQQLADEALNPPVEAEEEDEKDGPSDDFIYNPLKLPLGWDGKPIPFWLYKLHGLGHEYPCEICGNLVYTGRKNFEKHFGESTHIHGLKCLGITNGPMFKEVTSIEEALQLWNKLMQEKRAKQVAEENKIEMEDEQGNVMSEKTYNDLKAQGII